MIKLGRYEYGPFLLTIALLVAVIPAWKYIWNLPRWINFTLFVIVFFGINYLYVLCFLRYLCGKKLNPWIEAHGFTYDVRGFFTTEAHIQGQYHNRNVLIELWYGGNNQSSLIKCQVENPNNASFTLSRRSFLNLPRQSRKSPFDPYFDDAFQVKPTSSKIFLNDSLREQLVEIQYSTNVIDAIKFKKNELVFYYRGLITEEEKLDGALEAISLIAASVQSYSVDRKRSF